MRLHRLVLPFAVLLAATSFSGCMKYSQLNYAKVCELEAMDSETITLDPFPSARSVDIKVSCENDVAAYVILGATSEVLSAVTKGREPPPTAFHTKLTKANNATAIQLEPNQELNVVVYNPGGKAIRATIELNAVQK